MKILILVKVRFHVDVLEDIYFPELVIDRRNFIQ